MRGFFLPDFMGKHVRAGLGKLAWFQELQAQVLWTGT